MLGDKQISSSPIVRPASQGDELNIHEVLNLAYRRFAGDFQPTALTVSVSELRTTIHKWLVLTIDAQVVGCVRSELLDSYWTFCFLSVHPNFRGNSMGQFLLDYVVQRAIDSECPEIRVILRKALTKNITYFERNGFVYLSPFLMGSYAETHAVYGLKLGVSSAK